MTNPEPEAGGDRHGVARAVAAIGILTAVLIVASAAMWRGPDAQPTGPVPSTPTATPGPAYPTPPGGCPAPPGRSWVDAPVTSPDQDIPVRLVSAAAVVDTSVRPAAIARSGQLTGTVPAGSYVWLLSYPRPDTVDSTPERNPGSGRAYPISEITTADGCWSLPPRATGYDEALGIDYDQLVLLVDAAAAAEFSAELAAQRRDGFSLVELDLRGARTIATFLIGTEP